MKKNTLYAIILVVEGIFFAVFFCEIILRVMGLGYARSACISDPYLHHVNPSSFKFVAHSPTGEFDTFTSFYNDKGFRQRNMERAQRARYRLALLGDSFTLSRELPYDSAFPGILENALSDSTAILNFAVASYSPILYAIQWERIVKHYNPTHVIVQLYTNDIGDDKRYAEIAHYDQNSRVTAVPGPKGGRFVIKKFLLKLYFVRFVYKIILQLQWVLAHKTEYNTTVGGYVEPNPDISQLSKCFMLQLVDQIIKDSAELMITVIPSKCRHQGLNCDTTQPEFSHKWQSWAEENDISFLDLVKPFKEGAERGETFFFEKDIHFNAKGSRFVAKEIMLKWPELFRMVPIDHSF